MEFWWGERGWSKLAWVTTEANILTFMVILQVILALASVLNIAILVLEIVVAQR